MASLYSFDLYSDTKYSVLAVVFLSCGYLLSSVSRDYSTEDNNLLLTSRPDQKWMRELRNLTLRDSRVVRPQDTDYHSVVQVYNGECHNSPEVVLVAGTREDVAEVVRFVAGAEVELSVRSGGHSYSCTSSRAGGLQLDLRGLSSVSLLQTERSPTGWAARLGPGATWASVLERRSGCPALPGQVRPALRECHSSPEQPL